MSVNLLDLARHAMRGLEPEALSHQLGESAQATDQAMILALPAVLGGLIHQSLTLNAAGALLDVIDLPQIDASFALKVGGLLSDGAINFIYHSQAGTKLMVDLFLGQGLTVANSLGSITGIKVSSANHLLSISTVLILSLLKNHVRDHNLGAAGLVEVMKSQRRGLLAKIDTRLALAFGSPSAEALLGVNGAELEAPEPGPNPVGEVAVMPTSSIIKTLPWAFGILFLVSLIVVLRTCDSPGSGNASAQSVSLAGGAVGTSSAPVPASAAPASPLPALEKIYFDSGKYETPDSTSKKVSSILAYAKAHGNSRLAITGFHDTAEEAEPVIRLARQRSIAVRSVLISAGVSEERILMQKAQESMATVGIREATRVEVSITP
jgi:Bacterial protein of unknown function (DUF937)/OmpA family